MELLYACTLCNEKIAKSGRGGHLKFSGGNGHGPRGEMPDGYDDNTEDYFAEVEVDAAEDEPIEPEGNGENSSESTGSEDGSTEGNDQSSASTEDPDEGNAQRPADKPDAGASESNPLARIKRFLTTPVKDL